MSSKNNTTPLLLDFVKFAIFAGCLAGITYAMVTQLP